MGKAYLFLVFPPFVLYGAHVWLKYFYGKNYYKKLKPLIITKDVTFKSIFKIKKNDED